MCQKQTSMSTSQLIMSIPNTWREVSVKKQIEKIEGLCQEKDIEKSARIIESIRMTLNEPGK